MTSYKRVTDIEVAALITCIPILLLKTQLLKLKISAVNIRIYMATVD